MYAKYLLRKGYDTLEPQWENGVFIGVNDMSQELIIGTDKGVITSTEFRHKGSEEERWNFEEVNKLLTLRVSPPAHPETTPGRHPETIPRRVAPIREVKEHAGEQKL